MMSNQIPRINCGKKGDINNFREMDLGILWKVLLGVVFLSGNISANPFVVFHSEEYF